MPILTLRLFLCRHATSCGNAHAPPNPDDLTDDGVVEARRLGRRMSELAGGHALVGALTSHLTRAKSTLRYAREEVQLAHGAEVVELEVLQEQVVGEDDGQLRHRADNVLDLLKDACVQVGRQVYEAGIQGPFCVAAISHAWLIRAALCRLQDRGAGFPDAVVDAYNLGMPPNASLSVLKIMADLDSGAANIDVESVYDVSHLQEEQGGGAFFGLFD